MRSAYWAALVLVVIGALNWGLVGLFDFDLVAALFGPFTAAARAVYITVGVAGIVLALTSGAVRPTPPTRPAM